MRIICTNTNSECAPLIQACPPTPPCHDCRRGAAEATQLTQELSQQVNTVRGALCNHMRREELEVLPLLQAHLCVAEQRSMVWRMLRAMPLRLLQRVMPVVAGTCPPAPLVQCSLCQSDVPVSKKHLRRLGGVLVLCPKP